MARYGQEFDDGRYWNRGNFGSRGGPYREDVDRGEGSWLGRDTSPQGYTADSFYGGNRDLNRYGGAGGGRTGDAYWSRGGGYGADFDRGGPGSNYGGTYGGGGLGGYAGFGGGRGYDFGAGYGGGSQNNDRGYGGEADRGYGSSYGTGSYGNSSFGGGQGRGGYTGGGFRGRGSWTGAPYGSRGFQGRATGFDNDYDRDFGDRVREGWNHLKRGARDAFGRDDYDRNW